MCLFEAFSDVPLHNFVDEGETHWVRSDSTDHFLGGTSRIADFECPVIDELLLRFVQCEVVKVAEVLINVLSFLLPETSTLVNAGEVYGLHVSCNFDDFGKA